MNLFPKNGNPNLMDLEITQIPEKEELQKHQQEGPGKKGKIGHSCEAMVWKKG